MDQTNIQSKYLDDNDELKFEKIKSKQTLNKYGKMSLTENPHFKLARTKLLNKSRPILELGCAFGFYTKLLLNDGFQVIANDLDQRHLTSLFESIESDEERKRLQLKAGNLVDLSFADGSLNGVVGLMVLHFLSGQEIRDLFKKCYKWLAPNGLLVFSAVTPYMWKNKG